MSNDIKKNPNIRPQDIAKVQSLILQLSNLNINRAHSTFIALTADPQIDSKTQEEIDETNQYFMKRFSIAVLGNNTQTQSQNVYQKIQIQSAIIYLKQQYQNGKLIRLLFFPLRKYQTGTPQTNRSSYVKMVLQFYLFSKYIKSESTQKNTLISISQMSRARQGREGRRQSLKVIPHLQSIKTELKKNFQLEKSQILSKLHFIIDIAQQQKSISLGDKIQKQQNEKSKENKIYFLTKDNTKYPLYGVEAVQSNLRLKQIPTILLEKQRCVDTVDFHLHFSYKQFKQPVSQAVGYNVLDKNIVSGLWSIILAIIYPIKQVKQMIYKKYNLKTQIPEQKKEETDDDKWINRYGQKVNFRLLNEHFGFNQYNSQKNQLVAQHELQQQVQNNIKKQPQVLKIFTQQFQLNTKFANQQQNFIHAMLLDQINRISHNIQAKNNTIQQQTDQQKRFPLQKTVIQYTKIIVRFLKSIKNHSLFNNLLQNYEAEFYEHLVDIYLEAYMQFCYVNNSIYGRLFNLSKKIMELLSGKSHLLQVVKSVNQFTQIYKISGSNVEQLRTKKRLLVILLDLLQQNKSNQRDRQVETKILTTKYDLGSTYQSLAILQDSGNINSQQLKDALKILFKDLYQNLFIDHNNFNTQFRQQVGFTQMDLLQKISGILKVLNRLDLSIQIQKKLDNQVTVQNYINRWLMRYRTEMGQKHQQQIMKILRQAIEYFKIKFEPQKVNYYYGLIKLHCKTMEEKRRYDNERIDYKNDLRDQEKIKRITRQAKTVVFPLTQETINQITKIYTVKSFINER